MDTLAVSTPLEQVSEVIIEPGVDGGGWPLPLRQTRTTSPGRAHLDLLGRIPRCRVISDADILHAVRNSMRWVELDDDLTMLIGAATNGAPLEVGVLDIEGDDPVAIHAMPLRPKFYRFLTEG